MPNSSELDKQREIMFSADPPGQLQVAYELLSHLGNCRVDYCPSPNCLRVYYNLRDHTLQEIEQLLLERGLNLDNSMLRSIERNVIHYSEDTICHNMDIPMQKTKKNEQEVFIKAYEQEPHGDHDDVPPELRDYK
jgi:hypothetical protein